MTSIICDHFNISEERTYAFTHEGKDYQAQLTPRLITLPGVGEYDGHVNHLQNTTRHRCGLSGFGYSPDDRCLGCEELHGNSKAMEKLKEELRQEGMLMMYRT
ncbi:hypothetical protein JXA12_00440 [Candidatus Woesearchaeota archaeon]|nr:hypothetical protein [Candidatus Woesearchaeota archaeon]